MAVTTSHGIKGKFVKMFSPGSSEHLAIVKLDEVITAFNAMVTQYNALLAKLDADTGVVDTDYASAVVGAKVSKTATDQLIPSPLKQDV